MAKRTGLGKGLDSLIPDEIGIEAKERVEEFRPDKVVKITKVEPNRKQPRKNFDEDALLELAESIKQYGLLQPILVQDRTDHYEIIAGERRWRAAKIAGLTEVPVIIKNLTEQEIVEISLIENIQREDLNPIEEAMAYKRLLEEFSLKQDEVAERVSKSRSAITNSMRLLKLNEEVQQMLISDMISQGHARTLLGIEDQDLQLQLATRVFDEKLSVRDIEKLVKNLNKPKSGDIKREDLMSKNEDLDFIYRNLEEKMKIAVGTKVSIVSKSNGKGKIELEYFSNDELERIVELITSVEK